MSEKKAKKDQPKNPFRAGEKIPPHNLEAEVSVLGSLLLNKDAIIRIADFLRATDFYSPKHALIYSAIIELYEHREPIDILSLSNKLNDQNNLDSAGGESTIASLAAAVPTAGHVEHYARIVQKKATLRRLISAAASISELGFNEESEVNLVLDEAEQNLFAVSQQHLRQSFVPMKTVLTEAFHRIDSLHKGDGNLRGLPTGFGPLDNLLSGLQRSDLVILAARPSVGKTSLALDLARHIAVREKAPVGIFSIEMSKEQLADRFICAEAGVDLWKMRTGHLSSEGFPDDDFSHINRAMAVLSEAPIFIDDSASSNIMEIRTLARRLQSEHGIGFLVIDYLQLLEGDSRDGRVQEVSQISRALKSLARELNVPILALSQLSRAVETRLPPVPKLSDLRESGSIEQDADVVLFLYPRGRHEKTAESPNIVDVIIAKHRNGPTGVISLYFKQECASFAAIDTQHYQTEEPARVAQKSRA
jgi:replicative DNA helicase